MIKTQNKHWRNGYQVRGGWFKTWAFSFLSYGVIINNTKEKGRYWVTFYKLMK